MILSQANRIDELRAIRQRLHEVSYNLRGFQRKDVRAVEKDLTGVISRMKSNVDYWQHISK